MCELPCPNERTVIRFCGKVGKSLFSVIARFCVIFRKISTGKDFGSFYGGRVIIAVHFLFLDIPNSNGYFLTSSLVSGEMGIWRRVFGFRPQWVFVLRCVVDLHHKYF